MVTETAVGESFLTTKVSEVANWARKNSLWPMPFGTACCAIEFMSVVSAHYDLSRFGAEVVRFSPRQSDLLMVMGTIVQQDGAGTQANLRADARAEMGHLDGRLRHVGRVLSRISRDAGH